MVARLERRDGKWLVPIQYLSFSGRGWPVSTRGNNTVRARIETDRTNKIPEMCFLPLFAEGVLLSGVAIVGR